MTGPPAGSRPPAAATSQGPGTRTRASQPQNTDALPSSEELAKVNRVFLPHPKQARELLAKNGYLPLDVPVTLPLLSYALLLLVQAATPKVRDDGIRAVARILENEAIEKSGELISSYVIDKMSPLLDRAEQVMANMTNSTEEVRKEADRLYRTGEDTQDEILKSVESLNNAVEHIEAHPTPSPGPNPTPSYAAAVINQLPLTHQTTMARARTRERQILIDKDPNVDDNGLANLNERELVAKANEALEMTRNLSENEEVAENATVIGAKKLRNGGVILELNISGAAQLIKQERKSFETYFGGSSIVKDRSVSVIVENVPIGYSPNALAESQKIERDSGLEPNSLLSTRWIKPLHRRSPDQRTAHIIARFRTPEAANVAIRDGIIIAGKRSWARRMKREPRRCLKCHSLESRHIAAECVKPNVCGTCGKDHRTAECSETDSSKFHCANCNTHGHASWDHSCPKFVDRCRKLESMDPENSYKYLPSEVSWTWEQRGLSQAGVAPTPSPPPPPPLQDQDFRQYQERMSSWYEDSERNRPWSRNSRRDQDNRDGNPPRPQGLRGSGPGERNTRQTTLPSPLPSRANGNRLRSNESTV